MRIQYTFKDLSRFLSKVSNPDINPETCQFYLGRCDEAGYGIFSLNGGYVRAHQFAYKLGHGDIPDGLMVLHTCSANYPYGDMTYRRCIRTDHLKAGTQMENVRQAIEEGRWATGDRNPARRHPERMPRGDRNGQRLHPERTARGEATGHTKLTVANVLEIRQRCARMDRSGQQAACARDFGVDPNTIYLVVHRKIWKHV